MSSSPPIRPGTPDWTSPLKATASAPRIHRLSSNHPLRQALAFDEPEDLEPAACAESTCMRTLSFDEEPLPCDAFTESDGTASPTSSESRRTSDEFSLIPSYESLASTYEVDFLHVPERTKGKEFFEVRELVLQIELYIHQFSPNNCDVNTLRERIRALIHGGQAHSFKMGELGMILFYLDHPKHAFPDDAPSLIAFRSGEIAEEVRTLVEEHEAVCTNPLIPSGKTHYLTRAFAHMAMTSSQQFNKGGVYALIHILTDKESRVPAFLRPEHHEHIVIVARQLLANPAFEGLFGRSVRVHPDLKDAIRIDLKLNPSEKILPVHIFWDCFMFLFADIRQIGRPNCYAVGGLIYAMENAPYKTLENLIKWLSQGHYAFDDHTNIPIAPLLQKRLVYSRDLQVKLPSDRALTLTTFRHIGDTLSSSGSSDDSSTSSDEMVSLGSSLQCILQQGEAAAHLPYAEKLYYAYKFNTLGHLALSVMEFAYINSPPAYVQRAHFSEFKEDFLTHILRKTQKSLAFRFPKAETSALMKRFQEKMEARLWLENCSESDVRIDRGTVYVAGKAVEGFDGDPRQLMRLFEESLRIFYLEGDRYMLLESPADLQEALSTMVRESAIELKREGGKSNRALAEHAQHCFGSYSFSRQMELYTTRQINLRGISGASLKRCDLLLFRQPGGIPDETLRHVFGMDVKIRLVRGARTAYQFLQKMISALRTISPASFQETPRLLAFTRGAHIWTLSPSGLRLLHKPSVPFSAFIQRAVFDTVDRRMNAPIPSQVSAAILDRLTDDDRPLRGRLERELKRVPDLTYGRFREVVRRHIPLSKFDLASEGIDDYFGRVHTPHVDLSGVFRELGITISDTKKIIIADALPDRWMHPYQIAQLLRRLLIEQGAGAVDPYDLELAICTKHALPVSFDLGDLNWDEGEYREDPPHPHLVIRYNWADRTLSYYQRESGGERIQGTREFECFEIQHPRFSRGH